MDSVVFKPKNEETDIQLRRYRDTLSLGGAVVIALSIWSIIKLFIGFFLGEDTITKIIGNAMEENSELIIDSGYENLIKIILWVSIILMLLTASFVIFLFHYYIGINAYRSGRQGKKKPKRFYLVLTVFSAAFSGWLIIWNVVNIIMPGDEGVNIDLAFLMMEVTTFANYVLILYSEGRIKTLEKAGGQVR